MFRKDLIFLHPPSVYDFRKQAIMFGPISDVVPSSPALKCIRWELPVSLTALSNQNCSICGGSSSAYKKICNRDKPAFRPPKLMLS